MVESVTTAMWTPEAPLPIGDDVIVGPAPVGWVRLDDAPLVVLVGLTGAGKTTLAAALTGLSGLSPLPDRRRVTDAVILGAEAAGMDRSARFAATARFRELAPGGMGEILGAMATPEAPRRALLFDGLRGEAEVRAFARRAPRALFLALDVRDEERARRIARRRDRFDGAASGSADAARELVATEARHYDMAGALTALREGAPGRHHVIDGERQGVPEVVAEAEAAITAAYP